MLTLFPSPILVLHDDIHIVCVGQGRPTDLDFKHFILVKKQTFFNTPTWLQIYNLLYQNIIINYDLLSFIPNEFIFKSILLRVIIINNNSSECKD